MIRSFRVGLRTVEYTLICAKNRSSLLLQALPQGRIRLYAPTGYGLREADRLVRSKLDELDRAHAKMAESRQVQPDTLLYEGRRYRIVVERAGAARIALCGDTLSVKTPCSALEDINAQIKRWLARNALVKIRTCLDLWSPTVGKPYGRVTIREQKTRWGSCSSKSTLNFNRKLIMAPPQVLEYVVVHELCHLIYLNHSERYWAEVRKRLPDYETWKKWLKKHGQELRFPEPADD